MTAGDRDPVVLLARALDQTGALIARVRPEQATLPTPCRSWDVGALVNHVVQDVQQFTARAAGEDWEPHDADLLGEDWAGAWQAAADALLAAWGREGALDRTVTLPFGEVPATWQVDQQIADLAVHGWDLARATGQPTDLDPELGRLALSWGRDNLKPQFRGDEASGHAPCAPTKQRPFPLPAVVLSARLNRYYGRLRRPPGPPPTSRCRPVIGRDAPTAISAGCRAGEGLPSSRRHLLSVPRPIRRGVLGGCTSRIFTASMAFTLISGARHSLSPTQERDL